MRMIESYFSEQRDHLNYFFDHIDFERTEKIFQRLLLCKGTILFTGVGKSGIIAHKLAMTLLSTGTKAMYIPATDAMHGDLGMVDGEDVIVFLSKSGYTDELVSLLPFVKKKGASTVAIVSNENSPLYENCDLSISLPISRELCPFDLAPTTSTQVQLIFGDILAVAMMNHKNFTLSEYARNHPAGAIGKKISLTVEDLMVRGKNIPIAKESDLLMDVLFELSEKRCGCLLITDSNQKLLGIFTDGDLRRALQRDKESSLRTKLSELMTKDFKKTEKTTLAYDAMKQMEEDPNKLITVLPVIEKDKLVGIIRIHDILQLGLS